MKMFAAFFMFDDLLSFRSWPRTHDTVEGWNVDGPVHSELSRMVKLLLHHNKKTRYCNSSTRGWLSPPTWGEPATILRSPGTKRDSSLKIDLTQLPPVTFYRLRDHCGVSQMEIPTRRNANLAITEASRQECVQLARCVILCFCTELILKCWLTAAKCRKPKSHLCG